MTATDRAGSLSALHAALQKKYKPEPPPERSAVEELVHAMLLWESTTAKADRAYRRLIDSFVDLNELRVSRPDEIAEILGRTYPLGDERSRRLLASLESIYLREHAVSLDAVAASGKRDARKYLDSIESLPAFVVARVAVLRLEGHGVPLEARTVESLIAAGVLEEGSDLGRSIGQMERMVKASDALEFALLLQAWTDDGLPAIGRSGKKTTKKKVSPGVEPKPARKPSTASPSAKKITKKKVTKRASGRGN